jgi:hypothetical protein
MGQSAARGPSADRVVSSFAWDRPARPIRTPSGGGACEIVGEQPSDEPGGSVDDEIEFTSAVSHARKPTSEADQTEEVDVTRGNHMSGAVG